MKKISFCITCKNRLHQISQTLKANLDDNRNIANDVEFILVDFDSTDGLKDWIVKNFKAELKSGYLKFFFTKELNNWHASIAKNTAHFLASGEILVNLDCDNFTGNDGGAFVLKQFDLYGSKIVLHQASENPSTGSFGRISMLKKYFISVGGYDESFKTMGFQDNDLIHRLVEFGLFYVTNDESRYNCAITNTQYEKIKYTNSDMPYMRMIYENKLLSKKNILLGRIIANEGEFGIRKNIFQ